MLLEDNVLVCFLGQEHCLRQVIQPQRIGVLPDSLLVLVGSFKCYVKIRSLIVRLKILPNRCRNRACPEFFLRQLNPLCCAYIRVCFYVFHFFLLAFRFLFHQKCLAFAAFPGASLSAFLSSQQFFSKPQIANAPTTYIERTPLYLQRHNVQCLVCLVNKWLKHLLLLSRQNSTPFFLRFLTFAV